MTHLQMDLSMLINKCAIRFSCLLVFISGILVGQYKTSDFGFFGKVESVASVTYLYENPRNTAVSGLLDSEQFDSVYFKFDRRRNLILRENYLDYRGKLGLFDKTVFQINPSNQLEKVETKLVQNGEEPQKISQLKIFYYLKNQLVRLDEFNSGRTTDQYWVTNYKYERGEISEKVFWMEDEVFSKDEFIYNLKGEIDREINYHNNGNTGKTIDYEYVNGKLNKIITRSGNEKTTETFIYDTGYLSGYQLTENSGKTLQKKTFRKDGLLSELQKFNHKTQQIDNYSFKFEIDRENNWTECEISLNKTPIYIIKRTIKYFNN